MLHFWAKESVQTKTYFRKLILPLYLNLQFKTTLKYQVVDKQPVHLNMEHSPLPITSAFPIYKVHYMKSNVKTCFYRGSDIVKHSHLLANRG